MADVVLMTPREIPTGARQLHNENVVITDEEYSSLDAALRIYYEKIRENLGIACIASHLRQKGHSVLCLNMHGRNPSDEAIREVIAREKPFFVGISVMYDLHIIDAVRLARCIREQDPDVHVSAGGAFCTYNAGLLALKVPEIDSVAFGEGELTVQGLVDSVKSGSDWRSVSGLFYAEGGRVKGTGPPQLPNLAEAPWPARDVLVSHRSAGIPTPVASTYTSRGCHANCTFCYAPRAPGSTVGERWRLREPGDVVDEIQYLQRDFGTQFVWFNDDNFSGAFAEGTDHAMGFAEEILRRGVKVSFHCEFRVDSGLVDREVLKTLRRAGLASALLGLETGSPGMLKRFRKGTTIDYNLDAARMFKKLDVELDPGWIMIEPNTSLAELWENHAFIVASRIHQTDNPFFLVNRAIALRGTEMFDAIESPLPPEEDLDEDPTISDILRETRREYRVSDPRVEALWKWWSLIGGQVSDRKENRLPFVANSIAQAIRASGDPARRTALRDSLTRLRGWRSHLPELFLAFMSTGLLVAEAASDDLDRALETALRELIDGYDERHLGAPFDRFADAVQEQSAVLSRAS